MGGPLKNQYILYLRRKQFGFVFWVGTVSPCFMGFRGKRGKPKPLWGSPKQNGHAHLVGSLDLKLVGTCLCPTKLGLLYLQTLVVLDNEGWFPLRLAFWLFIFFFLLR